MAGVPELEANRFEVRHASTLQQRVLAGAVPAPRSDSPWPDPTPFEDAAEERDAEEPREMDWEDDEPAEPERRRRWFRR
jgi:hypothetical protein